jgi:hypothetical protein
VVEALMLHKERAVVVCQSGHKETVPSGGDSEEAHS